MGDSPLLGEVAETHFREVLGHFATGVAIITASDGDEIVGMSVNSFTSVSLSPPLIAFCAASTSTTYPRIRQAPRFCVNILAEEQEEVARRFAARGVDRIANLSWRRLPSGAVVLADGLAWLECEPEDEHAAGDHYIVVGRVTSCDVHARNRPLVFYRGAFRIDDRVE
jgi:3-hydroxy-9,10-secoandrosta-1,3,5(10)-triene-9,17-dione monooxygenase reductase component